MKEMKKGSTGKIIGWLCVSSIMFSGTVDSPKHFKRFWKSVVCQPYIKTGCPIECAKQVCNERQHVEDTHNVILFVVDALKLLFHQHQFLEQRSIPG